MKKAFAAALGALACVLWIGAASASAPGTDVRLTHDANDPGYVSSYTLATGIPYTDPTLEECSIARGRQNEPSVAVDPRNTQVLVGSSNDYCGVYNQTDSAGHPVPTGPIWLGYYRSEDSGRNFVSSLVPGYPDDHSPYRRLSQARTASAGDPVIAWDNHGRAFFGSESSDDPAGSPKTFGDVWVARYVNTVRPNGPTSEDGKRYAGTTIVERGSSAPNLLGKFNDKTAIEVDRTGGRCEGDVYFSWSRFSGNAGGVSIMFARSTDHGRTFSTPQKVSKNSHDVQFPDIAVTGNGDVYVVYRQFADSAQPDAILYSRSTDCGQTFGPPRLITRFLRYDAVDLSAPEAINQPAKYLDDPMFEDEGGSQEDLARDCGDFGDHCESGFTFFRRDTQVRATANQTNPAARAVYVVYDPSVPGTQVPTGSTYGSIEPGTGSQSAIYFIRVNGPSGAHTTPKRIDPQATGHQTFPDISADGGVLHAIWWDSRNDPCYSPTRPIGNCEDRSTVPSLDVYASRSTNRGTTWSASSRVSDETTNPNYEQFDNRSVPFAGDYLWVTSLGNFAYTVWTDWRNTVQGTDPREGPEDEDAATADVLQCRVFDQEAGAWSGDRCPHAGGIDQNIYGDYAP